MFIRNTSGREMDARNSVPHAQPSSEHSWKGGGGEANDRQPSVASTMEQTKQCPALQRCICSLSF